MSKKLATTIALILAILVIAGLFWLRNHGEEEAGQDAIRIGVVLPLSGSMAEYGDNGRKGLQLAKEGFARKGVVVNLLVQDTKEAPEDTVVAVRRLIDVDGVKFIIGGLTSSGVLAAAPYAQRKGVLFFSPAASAPGIPEIGDLVLRNWQSDSALADKYGRFAATRLGLKQIAILSISNDYGNTNADAFSKSFEKSGGRVVYKKSFAQGSSDFRDLITALRGVGGLDSIFLIGYPDEYRSLFAEMRRQQVSGPTVLVSDTFFSPAMPNEIGTGAEGVVCAIASKPDASYAPRNAFIAAYKNSFKKEPGLVSDTAFDALNLVVDGILATDGQPEAVSKWLLARRNYPGGAGVTNFTPSGDFEGGMAVYRVQKGNFNLVGP